MDYCFKLHSQNAHLVSMSPIISRLESLKPTEPISPIRKWINQTGSVNRLNRLIENIRLGSAVHSSRASYVKISKEALRNCGWFREYATRHLSELRGARNGIKASVLRCWLFLCCLSRCFRSSCGASVRPKFLQRLYWEVLECQWLKTVSNVQTHIC